MKTKKNNVKVYRTVEATVFELLTAILVVIMWCVIGWIWNKTPDVIPIHFNGSNGVFYVLLPVGLILAVIVYYIIRIYRVR